MAKDVPETKDIEKDSPQVPTLLAILKIWGNQEVRIHRDFLQI